MGILGVLTIAALSAGLPPELLIGLCYTESRLQNVIAFHDGGSPSYGVCQVKLQTARMVDKNVKASDLLNPEKNARVAALYLVRQLRRYHGDIGCGLAAYNAGTVKCARKMTELHTFLYTQRVLTSMKEKPWTRMSESKTDSLTTSTR